MSESNVSPNVVDLRRYKSAEAGRTRAVSPKAEQILQTCQRALTEHLSQAVPAMLDRVDDALFDLADKATSNEMQSLYFEAMREVRLRRRGMEDAYYEHLARAMRERPRVQHDTTTPDPLESSGSLDLVDDEELEESLAITNMVSKVRSQSKGELFAFEKRIGALLGRRDLEGADDPLGPEVVCNAFREACRQIESGIEVRLIVLKLFDRYVVAGLPTMYQALNRYLVEQGVLPQIRAEVRNQPAAPAPRGAPAGPPAEHPGAVPAGHVGAGYASPRAPAGYPGHAGDYPGGYAAGYSSAGAGIPAGAASDLYGTLEQLLGVSAAPDGSVAPGGAPGFAGVGAPATLSALTEVQRHDAAQMPATANVLREVKGTLAEKISDLDAKVVDIVAMMFDYILDDKDMPASMKALIGRLQIPLVKVAMLDQEFFSRRFHPARRLLNTLAEASVARTEEQHDALYQKAESIVHRVLDEFVDDLSIFPALLEELEQFLAQEEAQAEDAAEQSANTIEAREMVRESRKRAQRAIWERLEDDDVPELLCRFLDRYWKEHLIVICCEHGSESEPWQQALDTMDELIWSVTPKESAEERSRLLRQLPGLIRRLNEGMELARMPRGEREALKAELAQCHAAVVRPRESEPRARSAPPAMAEAPQAPAAPARRAESELLDAAVHKANAVIHRSAEKRPECTGMGTTLVAGVFWDDRVSIAHVGDSRLYRLRGEAFERLTTDHSLLQQLIDRGFYSPEEAQEHVKKNVVTRALGGDKEVVPELQEQEARPGDLYLLCSDGLTDLVDDDEIRALLDGAADDLQAAADTLVCAANERGGKDNISVILVRVVQAFPAASAELGRCLEMAGVTDVGRKRSHNEDAIAWDPHGGVAVLADGMGGYNAGEVASAMAVHMLSGVLRPHPEATSEDAHGAGGDPLGRRRAFEEMFGADLEEVEEKVVRAVRAEQARQVAAAAEAMRAAPAQVEEAHAAEPGAEGEAELPPALDMDGDTEIEEIVLEGPAEGAASASDEVEDPFSESATDLEVGTWVEFRRQRGSLVRARLAWVSPAGTYLFTDRKGAKVAETSRQGLAVEMRRKTAQVIDEVPLFDRAMSQLTSRLRQHASSA